MSGARPRVLFVAEANTLSHAVRPWVLARALCRGPWEVHYASDPRYHALLAAEIAPGEPAPALHPIASIGAEAFLEKLSRGTRIFDRATLESHAKADLELIDEIKPALVISDFRQSLPVAARVRGVPCFSLVNAYWSPRARPRFLLPDIPLATHLGDRIGQALFDLAMPLAFAHHARPHNQLRRRYGLPSLPGDVRHVYTDGDRVLYTDVPELVPVADAPAHHLFLGPIAWAPSSTPPWWDRIPDDRPAIYVNLGSSGDARLLPILVDALARERCTVLVGTAGRATLGATPPNVFVAEYLPGDRAAGRAALVICNGGSPATYQALAAGAPLLGIAANLDQCLNMHFVERAGAGLLLHARAATPAAIRDAAVRLISTESYRRAAGVLAAAIATCRAEERFVELVRETLAPKGAA